MPSSACSGTGTWASFGKSPCLLPRLWASLRDSCQMLCVKFVRRCASAASTLTRRNTRYFCCSQYPHARGRPRLH